jgi:hypothetical protein
MGSRPSPAGKQHAQHSDMSGRPILADLVDRQRFESALTGRFGYGRAPLHRRPLSDIVAGTGPAPGRDSPDSA